ncbi:MAG: RHS repeat domain-containing protein, partial [Mucilaginibacter sp.]
VQHWTVGAGTAAASNSGFYAQGTLSSITGINENGNSVTQYFDINAHLVCKKVQSGPGTFLYTYYLYDDYGNLRYVIPPLPTVPVPVTLSYSFLESDAIFVNFIYAYHYDGRNRVIEKKVPGKGWEYFVYNKLDRVILSQTPAQLALGVWSYTKYDSKGRVVMTGNYTTASTRATLQSNADAFNSTLLSESFTNVASNYGYTDASYPDNTVAASKTVLSVKFYDGYAYLSNSTINPNSTVFTAPTVDTISSFPQSLVTGILTKVLGASSATYLLSMSQYDTHGRTVKTVTQSYKSGVASAGNYDVVQNQFSFTDLLIKSVRTHYLASSLQLTISTFYKYDAHGRKILLQQQYNSGPLTSLAKYDYNELGQLMTKNLHNVGATGIPASSVFLQHLNYKYNIRGWLNFINNPQSATLADPQFIGQTDLFAEEIDYDQPNTAYSGTAQQFSGNISTLAWQTLVNPSTGLTQETKGYVLGYDGLNRLTTAYSKAPSGNDKYDETMTYDELGNILSLNRNATPTAYLNKLSYNYGTGAQRSNQLLSVQDNGGTENYTSTFSYAPNSGNETANSKTGVTQITYNELNLVSAITFSSGKTISVLYSSTGQKLERVIKQGPTVLEDRSYISGIEYVSNTITFIRTDEGRARFNGTNYIQEYAVTDHLGNVRAMFGDEDGNNLFTSADIVQQTDYYAFGRPISLLDANPQFQYKYNGKEFSTDLTEYDYGSRYYNPVIGRWVVIDPDAELNKRYSPYNYCVNNPIRNIDPDGNQWVWNSATYMFRWEPNVYQQSDLSDATDVFVGINYLYTGTNGLRSFLSGDGNHYDGVLMGNVDLIKDFLHRPENFEPVPKNAAGDPVGYIVPKPDMVRRIDSKTLWGIGTAADLGGETTTVLYGEAGAFGTIALVAGGYPALINILNGVGNDDDLIALGLSTVTIITQLSPVGWFGDAALGAAAIYNDLRTMPEGPMIDPMTVPIGGYEGSQFYPDGYNGSGQAPATPAPDNGNEDPGE